MPRHKTPAAQRADRQFAREMYAAAADALASLKALAATAEVESSREALAFLLEQAEAVFAHIQAPSEDLEPYVAHVAELHEDLEWIHPIAKPIVYHDADSGGAFVEALIWVEDSEVGLADDEDEDEDEDEDDFTDEDEDDLDDDLDDDEDYEDEE
jgi:hypothetical protein